MAIQMHTVLECKWQPHKIQRKKERKKEKKTCLKPIYDHGLEKSK